jgi:hypothetical protein
MRFLSFLELEHSIFPLQLEYWSGGVMDKSKFEVAIA